MIQGIAETRQRALGGLIGPARSVIRTVEGESAAQSDLPSIPLDISEVKFVFQSMPPQPAQDGIRVVLERLWARFRNPVLPALEVGIWLAAILLTVLREVVGSDHDDDKRV